MIYDLVIIGGAGAGLMAAIYAARKKMNTLLITKKIGGQCLLTNSIENFPGFDSISGPELISKIFSQLEKYNLPVKEGVEVESVKKAGQNFLIKTKEGESFETKTIIIATGKILRQLNVPGEKEFKNKGITYCSICDAPLFSGKDVAVVGGGNSGMESAMDLIKYANKVYLMSRGEKIKGDEFLQDKLKKTGKVEFITNVEIKEIKGNKFVEKIIYKDKKSGEEKELPVGGIFVNIGWVPATNFLEELIETNNHGEIITDSKTQQTSLAGIFAAGDVTDSLYKQIVIAVGDGAKATLSAYNYLIKEK